MRFALRSPGERGEGFAARSPVAQRGVAKLEPQAELSEAGERTQRKKRARSGTSR